MGCSCLVATLPLPINALIFRREERIRRHLYEWKSCVVEQGAVSEAHHSVKFPKTRGSHGALAHVFALQVFEFRKVLGFFRYFREFSDILDDSIRDLRKK